MDKETLSNYGWIVVCVMVLAVLLALASPFGSFIAGAIKSTTAGFFGVNQNAMNAAGIAIPGQTFQDTTTDLPVKAFAIYSEDDNSLIFYKNKDVVNIGDVYRGKTVTKIYYDFETESYETGEYITTPWWLDDIGQTADIIKTVSFAEPVQPLSTRAWFAQLSTVEVVDLTNLDTSLTTDMSEMFERCGYMSDSLTIIGLDKLNTSKVTTMNNMFKQAGRDASSVTLDGIENMDVSNVQDFSHMFSACGISWTNFYLDLSNWSLDSAKDIWGMFDAAGRESSTFYLDVTGWDVSNVENMRNCFYSCGYESSTWTLNGVEGWRPASATNMILMFGVAGKNAGYTLDLSGWNVLSSVNHTNFDQGVSDKIITPWEN